MNTDDDSPSAEDAAAGGCPKKKILSDGQKITKKFITNSLIYLF